MVANAWPVATYWPGLDDKQFNIVSIATNHGEKEFGPA
jgi:hypothetical protein